MKPWFRITGKDDHGPYSHWLGIDAKPVVWQGWIVTLLYYAVAAALIVLHLPKLAVEALAFGSLLLGLVFWHLAMLWLASRHFAPAGE